MFEATKLVLICYSSKKKLIQMGCAGGSREAVKAVHTYYVPATGLDADNKKRKDMLFITTKHTV